MTRLINQGWLQCTVERRLCARFDVKVKESSNEIKDHPTTSSHMSSEVGVDSARVEGITLH